MKTALYARVSTANQATGLESQIRALKAHCEANSITEYELFTDENVSGAKASRPGLDSLMSAVASGGFDQVVCYSFSRFSRSTKHLLTALETFNGLKIGFVSLSESINTNTPSGKMVFTVLAAVAALEREILAERVRCGIQNARAKGKQIGRPKQLANRELIKHLAEQNMSYRAIAKLAGCSPSTVCRELRAPVSKRVA